MPRAPRLLLAALASAALLALPAPASAQAGRRTALEKATAARDPGSALLDRLELAGNIGLAIPFENQLGTGFKLGAAGLYGFTSVAPATILQLGASLAWTYNAYGAGVDGSINAIDLLPFARVRYTVNPQLFAYADGGVGLALVHGSVTIPAQAPAPFVTSSSTDAALLVRLGGGLGFELQQNLALTLEPAFHFYAKSGSITQFTLLVGAVYRP